MPPIVRPQSFFGAGTFEFLNRRENLGSPISWAAESTPLLWRYNLHYFDFLLQPEIEVKTGFSLMRDWAQRNPPRRGDVGWEPYPLSLRIVNWLKFMTLHNAFEADLIASVSLQAENLRRQIEYHILGNHLFANAKALLFAGGFLDHRSWFRLGRELVLDQLDQQFLEDGGHFELSTMYHAIALEDLLDVVNLLRATTAAEEAGQLEQVASRALGWLADVSAPDQRPPLLNDAAEGIAPTFANVNEYARRLGIDISHASEVVQFSDGWTGRNLSGYWVVQKGSAWLLFDTAPLGPDYLPGHAHCDMLSVLFSLDEKSILTDTGVFEYAESARRLYSRSSAAHNTAKIDGLEQGDIWKSFRLGRRGHPINQQVTANSISCAHNGFSKWQKGLFHSRAVTLLIDGFDVTDTLQGRGDHRFEAFYHFAPGIAVEPAGEHRYKIDHRMMLNAVGASSELGKSDYYPEFGVAQSRPCLRLSGAFRDETQFGVRWTFLS